MYAHGMSGDGRSVNGAIQRSGLASSGLSGRCGQGALAVWGLRIAAGALLALAGMSCAECEDDYGCPGSEICNADGECEALVCTQDQSCAPGQICRHNRCETPTNEPARPPSPDAFVIRPTQSG